MKTVKTPKGTELPLLNLKGKDYLQVAHRLVWFREERPDWALETEMVQLTDTHSIVKALVRDPSGRVIATAHKREDKTHFADYMEKAETAAIGRALALVGYGTQFAEELDEEDRIVDSPLPVKATPKKQAVAPVANTVPALQLAKTANPETQQIIAETIDKALTKTGTGTMGAPFDLILKSGPHAGKQIQQLNAEQASSYFAEINEQLKAIDRSPATLRGPGRDVYYALQDYIQKVGG